VSAQPATTKINRPVAIAIFCRELKAGGDPFSSDYYWQAYQDLLLALKKHGAAAYLTTDNNSYRGFGRFQAAYTIDAKTTLDNLTKVEDVQVDVVFDRGGFIGRDVLTINPPIITKIASSKIEMYKHFKEHQPNSYIGHNKKQVAKAADKLPSEKVVVKEPEGSGGNEVYIGEKEDVLAELPNKFPVLVQEFMDTSTGVPGKVEGVHDVRLAICGGEIINYNIRSAQEGKLLANIAQGGEIMYYDVSEAPAELIALAKKIDAHFKDLPRYYSIDFMNTPDGWKMVELNSYLGLGPVSNGIHAERTLNRLADYLVAQATQVANSH